jgi:hypothetical protein
LRAVTSALTESGSGPRGGAVAPAGAATAVLMATADAEGGAPAATLAWEDGTLIGRLLDQLAGLDVGSAHVIARPAATAALEAVVEAAGLPVRLQPSPGRPADLRTIAEIARAATGAVVIAYADTVTQREALAGLLADPRVATGILGTAGHMARPFGYRTRVRRGRVMGASSA